MKTLKYPLKSQFDFIRKRKIETALLGVILISFISYIIFLKTTSQNKVLYIEASIQGVGEQMNSAIPAALLTGIDVGDENATKTLKVTDIRIFMERQKSWELSNANNYIGRIQLALKAEGKKDNYSYAGQELKVGNSLTINLKNRNLVFLITKVESAPIPEETYSNKVITVRLYNKRTDIIAKLKAGLTFKDNLGKEYIKFLELDKINSPMTTTDQHGSPYLKVDPLSYDITIKVLTLVKYTREGMTGYDGRPISIGSGFYFNDPLFILLDSYVIDVE
ncbi:MAG: hypothetical protein ABIM99_03060 [Candidatus Dojkabacteria bacterium]